MVREFFRLQKLSQQFKKNISIILQREIDDPALSMFVTVSNVEVSKDLSFAKVFVTFLNDQNSNTVENGLRALKKASGYIRVLLGKMISLRVIPKLIFFYDDSLVFGVQISNLIKEAVKR